MTKKNQFSARQGDVFLIAVAKIPDSVREIPRENGAIVLAHGEVTGHAHAIRDPSARFLELLDTPTRRMLAAREGAELRHEEHALIQLPAGNYEVIQQAEWAFAEVRNVAD